MHLGLQLITLRKPSSALCNETVDAASRLGFNHQIPGASGLQQPSVELQQEKGWREDVDAAQVGHGRKAFNRAQAALQQWKHMQLGWVDTNRPSLDVGAKLCIAAHVVCCWMRNPLAIVYVSSSNSTRPLAARRAQPSRRKARGQRFEFAASTLAGHSLAGEERFTLQWHKEDDSVWYEIYAFSKPASLLARIAYPLVQHFQKRFRRDSIRTMRLLINSN